MNPRIWFQSYLASRTISRSGREATKRKARNRLAFELLEDRTVPTAVAAPSGLVSWWTANSTPIDAMGLNNATLSNVSYTAGEVGNAFNFNGQNSWAALGDPSSLAFTSSFSIEGWIKVNGIPTNYNFGSIMFRGDDRGGLDPYQLVIQTSGDLQFAISGTNAGASIAAPIPIGQFVHVAATLDDATGAMTLYENGAVVAQTTTTARPFGALDPTQQPGVGIGNSNALSNYDVPFNGRIDELSVYNRALTAGEVLGIDKAGSDGKVVGPISVDFPSVLEGAAATTTPITVTISRSGNLSGPLTVNWTTADDSATAGTDYLAASGSVTFAAGQATQTIQVTVLGDNIPEANEDFKLIATPVGGTSVMGLGTILNDDAAISIGNDTATKRSTSIRPLGAFVPAGLGGLGDPYAAVVGPDGNVYVSSLNGSAVYRYDAAGHPMPAPGQQGAVFVPVGSGGLSQARDVAFGPDGNLYVVSQGTNAVLRYDPVTGAPLDALIAPGAGGLDYPRGLLFRNGYAYVTNASGTVAPGMNSVMRFDAMTGEPAGVSGSPGDAIFIASGGGGLFNPSKIVFGPDGMVYVSSTATTGSSATSNSILRYDPDTAAPAGISGQPGDAVFVSPGSGGLDGPTAMVFRPDGYLYVVGWRSNSVLRYQAANGAFAGQVVPSGSGGLNSPIDLLFDANGNLLVTSRGTNQILRYGAASQLAFTVNLLVSADASTATVSYATADGTALAGRDYVAASGTLTFPPGVTSQTIVIQTLDVGSADPTRAFTINLSSPTGGVITGGPGVGTILDKTKFYVVDGGSSDSTFHYASGGAALGNNALGSGDTAPRGVTSTAAGNVVWVVDANKNVYVYDDRGVLLGSWSAAGLSSSAQLSGIATNGTDIWLVDNQQHKVFKYAGAASRFSGSQNAATSFNLSSGNSNPKDIVTDGTTLWVVNDSSTDKVYRYTVAGALLGSWTIDPANSSPTGITLDPGSSRDLWIADNSTDRVYQYSSAANRISGSQAAASSFALSANDTNPQGIADPSGVGGDIINTTTALTASGPNPATAAQALAFNVAVDGGAADGDIVELHDSTYDGAFVASGILNSGIVTITVPPNTLAVGTHALVAVYPGNASKAPSLSSPITQVINSDAATSTALTATPNATTGGTLVTFTAVVSPDPGNLGSVSFLDNGAAIAGGSNIALTDGVATFQIATLVVGSHPITAVYSGAIGFAPSTSNAVDFAVTPAATTTILTAVNPGPASIAQSIAFAVTVAGGASADGETVVIKDASNGDAVVPTTGGPLSSGTETLTIAAGTLSVGQHQLYAVYAGDSFNAGSQSSQVIQTITNVSPPHLTGITVNGGAAYAAYAGNQRSMVVSLQLTFDQAVTLDPGAFALAVHAANVSGAIPTLSANTPDGGLSWIITFSGAATDPNTSLPGTAPANGMRSLVDGVYDIAVNSSLVRLASDPSVTGSSTTTQTIYRLFGNVSGEEPVVGTTHTATINTADNLPFRTAFNTVAGAPNTNYQAYFDFDGDGQVNTADNLQFRNRFNRPLSWSA